MDNKLLTVLRNHIQTFVPHLFHNMSFFLLLNLLPVHAYALYWSIHVIWGESFRGETKCSDHLRVGTATGSYRNNNSVQSMKLCCKSAATSCHLRKLSDLVYPHCNLQCIFNATVITICFTSYWKPKQLLHFLYCLEL